MPKASDMLVLRYDEFQHDSEQLFKELNNDETLRALFFKDPALVLRTKLKSLTSISLDARQDDRANRLLFSVLSNDKFKDFLDNYQDKKQRALARLLDDPEDAQAGNAFDETTIRMEIADAILRYGDKEIIYSLLPESRSTAGGVALAWWAVFVVVIVVVVVVHGVVKLGTDGDTAPKRRSRSTIPASELRRITEHLVEAARDARNRGELVDNSGAGSS